MALKFRLAYNEGFDYVDLFPKTNIESIEGKDNVLRYSEVSVTVPATTEIEQTIPLTLTTAQQNAPFYVELTEVNDDTLDDYSTINQARVEGNSLILTRLVTFPKNEIKIKLRFKEVGV